MKDVAPLPLGHIPCTGVLQKEASSFSMHIKPLIMLKLQTERCFSHLSAKLHPIWRRNQNRSAENEKSLGAELFTDSCNERILKDDISSLHPVSHYMTTNYCIA